MMNDDQYLLASAYADGEVTPAERALAEADPVVMAEVERLQALRGALREVTAPADAARASMIATALAEFDVAPVATPEAVRRVTPPVVSSRRPARWFNWERVAGFAAAAVAVVAIGAVVANVGRGGDDDDSASVDMAEAPATDAAADATAVLDAPADRDMTIEAATEAPADTAAAAATQAPAVMAEPADGAPAPGGDSTGSGRNVPVIETPEQLAAAGLELRAARDVEAGDGDDVPPTASTVAATDCTFTAAVESPLAIPEAERLRDELPELAERVQVLGLREYRVGPDPEHVRPALIAVDLDTGQAFAIDATGCALLAIGPLP
jgi:hypothetical protein